LFWYSPEQAHVQYKLKKKLSTKYRQTQLTFFNLYKDGQKFGGIGEINK